MTHLGFGLRTFYKSTKQPPKYAPNFKTKPNCQDFSHPKLNPVKNNPDTARNGGRKSRNKGREKNLVPT